VCEIGLKPAKPGRGAENRGPGPKQGPCHATMLPGDPRPRPASILTRPGGRGARLDNRGARSWTTGPAGPSEPQLASWAMHHGPCITAPGPFFSGRVRYVASSSMHRGPWATAELELQLAQLGPAHVASIKKPGHGPGFEWPAGPGLWRGRAPELEFVRELELELRDA